MDELMQSGLIGLNEALARFESGQGATFETYAARRIKGAMLDELRANDPLGREGRDRVREIQVAVHRLEHRLGRTPRSKEVAAELGWPLKKLHDALAEAGGPVMRAGDLHLDTEPESWLEAIAEPEDEDGLDDLRVDPHDPVRAVQQRERLAALHAAFDALDEIERFVMESIYDQDMDLRDIGKVLGVSGARVSQMSTAIVDKLRRRLQAY